MSVEISPEAMEAAARQMAHRLLYAMNFLILQHKRNVSVPFNTFGPSKPGEFPHLRTAHGRDGAMMDCNSIDQVLANGLVIRGGQSVLSWYMTLLARNKGRKGMLDTAEAVKPQVTQIVLGATAQ